MSPAKIEDNDIPDCEPEQPAAGQGDLCASCHHRASGQMCARDVDEPDLKRYSDGTEWCCLFESVEGES